MLDLPCFRDRVEDVIAGLMTCSNAFRGTAMLSAFCLGNKPMPVKIEDAEQETFKDFAQVRLIKLNALL